MPRLRPVWNKLIKPYPDTLASSYGEMRNTSLRDPYYAFIGSYEFQRLDYIGTCSYKVARQKIKFNDGAIAFPKGSMYTRLFNRV